MLSCTVPVLVESQVAAWKTAQGGRVFESRGRWWQDIKGFSVPVCPLGPMGAHDADYPRLLTWGFRAPLREQDAAAANGSMPVHILSDLGSLELESLERKQRSNVRKCQKLVEILAADGSGPLAEQGHKVAVSSTQRTAYKRPPTLDEYRRFLDVDIASGRQLVLVGLVNGALGGYFTGWACGDTAYTSSVHISSDALPTSIGSGLLFEFLQACRRTPGIKRVSYGLSSPEKPSLESFKASFGFKVTPVPTLVAIRPPIGPLLRRLAPLKYYRLTGTAP